MPGQESLASGSIPIMDNRTDIELLQIEIELMWDVRGDGRIHGGPQVILAMSATDQLTLLGADVPDGAARQIRQLIEQTPPQRRPEALESCARLLGGEVSSGPSYLIPPTVTFPAAGEIIRSDGADIDRLHDANPGNWEPKEWLDLLAGKLGPWAMAVHEGRVVSICHTPAHSDRAVEAGTWTDPQFRGQGHAAATTAAWLPLITASGRIAFYSTASQNASSQRVAARLGLRPIGTLWKCRRQ